jgi:hypothetical protein
VSEQVKNYLLEKYVEAQVDRDKHIEKNTNEFYHAQGRYDAIVDVLKKFDIRRGE